MKKFSTEQELFWAGQFGNEYTERNQGEKLIASNIALFSSVLQGKEKLGSILEFGPNRGLDLIALRTLLPEAEFSAVEINPQAIEELKKLSWIKAYQESILDFKVDYQRDFVLSKGLLIHINPEALDQAYNTLYASSSRYICLAEYYNPFPVEVEYRGNNGKLFKRDFAGEILDKYQDLQLLDYGFAYHRDNNFMHGDFNWFLMVKK